MKEAKKYILTVDVPAYGMKAGDEISGPIVDTLLHNGKVVEAIEPEKAAPSKKAAKEGAAK